MNIDGLMLGKRGLVRKITEHSRLGSKGMIDPLTSEGSQEYGILESTSTLSEIYIRSSVFPFKLA